MIVHVMTGYRGMLSPTIGPVQTIVCAPAHVPEQPHVAASTPQFVREVGGDRVLAQALAIVPTAGLDAVMVAVTNWQWITAFPPGASSWSTSSTDSAGSTRQQIRSAISVATMVHLAAYYDFLGNPNPLYEEIVAQCAAPLNTAWKSVVTPRLRAIGKYSKGLALVFRQGVHAVVYESHCSRGVV